MNTRQLLTGTLALALHCSAFAQQGVAINADGALPHPSAILDVDVSALPPDGKKGLLLPRVTNNAQRNGVVSATAGLLLFQTGPTATLRGLYYHTGSDWAKVGQTAWHLTGNIGTSASHFLGTADSEPLSFRVNNAERMRITAKGQWQPGPLNNGSVLIGEGAGEAGAGAPPTFANNVFVGLQAGHSNTGMRNTGIGAEAMRHAGNTLGNTAVGERALQHLTTGSYNTALGADAGVAAPGTTSHATSVGHGARAGEHGTAVGSQSAATGAYATAVGHQASAAHANSTALGTGAVTTTTDQVRIGNATTVQIGGYAPWTDLSDIRFKRDVLPWTDGLRLVRELRPIRYRLDVAALEAHIGATPSAPDAVARKEAQEHAGFSAQEVAATMDRLGCTGELVHRPQGPNDSYGINYARFVVPLVVAVQELDAEHGRLNERMDALEQRISAMEARNSRP